jgi:hypothetical protein
MIDSQLGFFFVSSSMDHKLNSVSILMDDLSNTSMNSDDTSTVSSKKTKENNNLFWLIKI